VAETCDTVAIMYAGEIIEFGLVEDIFGEGGHHPYTAGLFGSIPDMTKEDRRLHPIDGLMPEPTVIIEGCAFCSRCKQRLDICEKLKPAPVQKSLTHTIKCHLFKQA
jgi:peptide/nickel transport system ATP-binding protein